MSGYKPTDFEWTARNGVRVRSSVPDEAGRNVWMDHAWGHGFVSWYRWLRNIRRSFQKCEHAKVRRSSMDGQMRCKECKQVVD